jgi:cytochrome oxidase Cu insertion factor (SCO1/SenC/PrrC family)
MTSRLIGRPAVLAAALAAGLIVAPCAARAHSLQTSGEVLATVSGTARAIVRIDAPAGGARIATVQLVPASEARLLRPGARIDAIVDTDTVPWTLSQVRVVGSAPITGAARPVDAAPEPLHVVRALSTGDVLPSPPLVDQRGAPFAFRDLRGRWIVLAFVYTRCSDARECPLISAKFHALQERLRSAPVHLVEVSLDPSYDRPAVLARYGRKFGADPARWSLVTGDRRAVLDFAAQFQVSAFPDPRVGLIHTERTVLVDPAGVIRDTIDEVAWSPAEIVADIDHDRGIAANPIARLNLWLSSAAIAICGNSVAGFSGFSDLLIVIAIVGAGGYALWRLARAVSHGPA